MKKKAAMEMSVGTIVTIVLLMGVLVLGIFLIQRIFSSAKGAIDLTDEQLRNEINKLFSEENEIVIYPGTRLVEIKQESSDAIGFGLKNLAASEDTYSYSVRANPGNNCPGSFESENALNLIVVGDSEQGISIESGGSIYRKVRFEIPLGTPLCTVRYSIDISSQNGRKFNDFFDMRIKAK